MALAIAISLALILLTTLIHYEGLRLASNAWRASAAPLGRTRVLIVILWIFHSPHRGDLRLRSWPLVLGRGRRHRDLAGAREVGSFDYFYFSAEAFSTGFRRHLSGRAAQAGGEHRTHHRSVADRVVVSFTFIIMQRFWFLDEGNGGPRS
jgi:hypothetical protein